MVSLSYLGLDLSRPFMSYLNFSQRKLKSKSKHSEKEKTINVMRAG